MAKKKLENEASVNEELTRSDTETDFGEPEADNPGTSIQEDEDEGEVQVDLNALENELSEDISIPDDGLDENDSEPEDEFDDNEPEAEQENVEAEHSSTPNYRSRLLPDEVKTQDRIERAGKRAKRRIYRQEGVMTEDGLVKTKKENTLRHQEYVELSASAKTGAILKGKLTARRETPNGTILAVVQYGKYFTVNIPAEFMFDMSLQPVQESENPSALLKDLINRRMNSTVCFIVTYVNEKNGIAYGSHLHALARTARNYYVNLQRDQMPLVKKGMKVRGQVIQVNKIGVWVEALGAECFIRQDEIDWLRRSDISELYSVGDSVDVRVLDIKPHKIKLIGKNKELQTITISASIKQTEPNPNKVYYDQFDVNSSGSGEVTQVTDTGIFVIFSDKISVFCRPYDGPKQPPIGSEVLVVIENKRCDPEAGVYQFVGRIKWIIKEKVI